MFERLEKKLVDSFNKVWEAKEKNIVSMRTAAYIVGLSRIVEAINSKGTEGLGK